MTRKTYSPPKLARIYGAGSEATASAREQMRNSRRSGLTSLPTAQDLDGIWSGFEDMPLLFMSGSTILGWGHANSDLDFYAIAAESIVPDTKIFQIAQREVATTDPTIYIGISQVGSYRADIEFWTIGQLSELIDAYSDSAPDVEVPKIGRAEHDMLYRLSVGHPLRGEALFQSLRDRLLGGHFRNYIAASRKIAAESSAEDVAGMLESGDLRSAALAAHAGILSAMEGLLAIRGDFSVNRKWLARRAYAISDLFLVDELWAAMTLKSAYSDPRHYAEETLRLISRILALTEGGAR